MQEYREETITNPIKEHQNPLPLVLFLLFILLIFIGGCFYNSNDNVNTKQESVTTNQQNEH